MLTDLRHAVRALSRTPGFTLTAVVVLALGIGANTAVFSIVRAVLLRPLPYHEPERLVYLWGSLNIGPGNKHNILTGRHVREIVAHNSTLDSYAVLKSWENEPGSMMDALGSEASERLRGMLTTPNLFQLLGVEAALGRTLVPGDDETHPVVVISDNLWRRRFGADPGVIGRQVSLVSGRFGRATTRYTIAGVLPAAFRFTYPEETEVFASMPWSAIAADGALQYQMIARLKPGVAPSKAQAEFSAVAKDIVRGHNFPPEYRDEAIARAAIMAEPMPEHLKTEARPGVLLLAGIAALVLFIACVNLGLLVLARTVDRGRELAVRNALGAGRLRIVRQLLAEGIVLATAGGIAGVGTVVAALPVLRSLVPSLMPRGDEIGLDYQVLAFSLAAIAVTALVCGLVPAWLTLRKGLQITVRESAGSSTADRAVALSRRLIVAVQVAVVLVLLVGAGLLLKSFWRMQHVDLGFDARGVVTVEMRLLNAKYRQPGRLEQFQSDVLAGVRALPGVAQASITTAVPMRGVDFMTSLARGARMRAVDPEYFPLMGIRLLAGRLLSDSDTAQSPKVAVVSESLAHRLFGSENPLGRQLEKDDPTQVVGVVADVHYADVTKAAEPAYYLPRTQRPIQLICVVVRPKQPGLAIVPDIRRVVQAIDPEQPVEAAATVDQIIATSTSEKRFYALTTGAFAGTALLLAVAGLFGVVSRGVIERRREIAIRMALGADAARVMRMVLRGGLMPVAIGTAAGLAAAAAASRVLRGFLFEIAPTDPVSYAAAALLVLAVALAACYLPARRAVRVEPMAALKAE